MAAVAALVSVTDRGNETGPGTRVEETVTETVDVNGTGRGTGSEIGKGRRRGAAIGDN